MQNSLRRLLEGTVRALLDDVAPAVEDPYARAQALAAADVLANLATRIEWSPAYLLWWSSAARELLAEAFAAAPDEPTFAPFPALLATSEPEPDTGAEAGSVVAGDAVETWAAEHLAALAAAREWAARDPDGVDLGHRLDFLADRMLDHDLAHLRRL